MTYAIIETGGKQLRVEPGYFYDVERLHVEESGQLSLDRVLLVQHQGEVNVGQPFVEGAVVRATVLRHLRGRKVIVYKMRPKKKTRKKQGHRQELTRLMIEEISLNGSVLAGRSVNDELMMSRSAELSGDHEIDADVVDTSAEVLESVEATETITFEVIEDELDTAASLEDSGNDGVFEFTEAETSEAETHESVTSESETSEPESSNSESSESEGSETSEGVEG